MVTPHGGIVWRVRQSRRGRRRIMASERPNSEGKGGSMLPQSERGRQVQARALLSSFYGTGGDEGAAVAPPVAASGRTTGRGRDSRDGTGGMGERFPAGIHLQTDEGLDDGIQQADATIIDSQVGRWIGEQLRAKSLRGLLEMVNSLAADAAALEADQQDLVYEDYHKLTSVIGVLEDMTAALDVMEGDVHEMSSHIDTLIAAVDEDADAGGSTSPAAGLPAQP